MTARHNQAVRAGHTSTRSLLLGIDGGGTKTDAWLAYDDECPSPAVVGRGRSGSSNPQLVGVGSAQQNILLAAEKAFHDARLTWAPADVACVALAGVGREPIRQVMLEWSRRVPLARHVRVVHDAQAVLSGGTTEGWGAAVICGTGSFAYGESSAALPARAGGWGYLFGDEGSGFALGCAALQAVAHAADGRGATTLLTPLILDALQVRETAELIPAIYDSSTIRQDIAALSPCLFRAVEEGDQIAQQICHNAVDALCTLVLSIKQQLCFEPHGYELAMAGGVLENQPAMRDGIVSGLEQRDAAPKSIRLVTEPVAGALLLAARMLA